MKLTKGSLAFKVFGEKYDGEVPYTSESKLEFEIVKGIPYLTEREQSILLLRNLTGLSTQGIAYEYDVTKSRILHIEEKAMSKLKKYAGDKDAFNKRKEEVLRLAEAEEYAMDYEEVLLVDDED